MHFINPSYNLNSCRMWNRSFNTIHEQHTLSSQYYTI